MKQQFECKECKKGYKNKMCLDKHKWEHTQYWSQLDAEISKHQKVLLLEAATVLNLLKTQKC